MVTLPAYSVARASIVGAIRLQGLHHSAQKSTRTGAPDFRTVSSKFPSVNVCTLSFAIGCPWRLLAVGYWLSAIGCELSAIGYQRSAISLTARSYILTYSFA